jgi:hypothetical protein
MFASAMHICVCMTREQKDLMREKELHGQSRRKNIQLKYKPQEKKSSII